MKWVWGEAPVADGGEDVFFHAPLALHGRMLFLMPASRVLRLPQSMKDVVGTLLVFKRDEDAIWLAKSLSGVAEDERARWSEDLVVEIRQRKYHRRDGGFSNASMVFRRHGFMTSVLECAPTDASGFLDMGDVVLVEMFLGNVSDFCAWLLAQSRFTIEEIEKLPTPPDAAGPREPWEKR